MSYYPLFNLQGNAGFVNVANFAPNDWEVTAQSPRNVCAFRTDGSRWLVSRVAALEPDEFGSFEAASFPSLTGADVGGTRVEEVVFLSLRTDDTDAECGELPDSTAPIARWPEWRATIGFASGTSRVSYQGEINPTPVTASLLSFHPFIQFVDARNYFVFLNVERAPQHRWSDLEIFIAGSGKRVDVRRIRNNAANVICLDEYGFTERDLPVFYSGKMTGIPFGFGSAISSGMLSLEHTHPPGSLTIHGDRLQAQREIKTAWVTRLRRMAAGGSE